MRTMTIAVLIGLLGLAGAVRPLRAQQIITDPLLPEGGAKQVSPHVHVIMGFPNVVIVVGETGTLVVDTGLGVRNGALVARTAKTLSTKRQRLYLTTTHFHPEHASGQDGFPAGTLVIRPRVQQEELEADGPRMLALFASRSAPMKSLLDGARIGRADILFEHELDLDLGGLQARLLSLGAAHTRGDELIFVPEDSVLISGDVVQNKVSPNVICATCSPRQWIAVLDQIVPLAPKLIIPDHGGLGGNELIGQERAFLVDLEERSLALERQGKSAADAGRIIAGEFDRKYAGWQSLRNIPQAVQRAYSEARPRNP
jgi:glyoxylase-like metal-dependent hydrolase (beta-lactamase superfamily II)